MSIWHLIILLIVVLAIFGTKKLRQMGPDLGHAVREFRNALHHDDDDSADAGTTQQDNSNASSTTSASTQKSTAQPAADSETSDTEHNPNG